MLSAKTALVRDALCGSAAAAHGAVILIDTTVWVDHLREGDSLFAWLLEHQGRLHILSRSVSSIVVVRSHAFAG